MKKAYLYFASNFHHNILKYLLFIKNYIIYTYRYTYGYFYKQTDLNIY